ncbi:unnamed protein product [Cyprideis torosa]|uniref:Uncharacterized protein n=1 Tax=Cyprideis torosa TaxID=163714 RepID=A0A7R8W9E0_9CRUS|nr:unnamed protein product [Cyprideis torosa]CAG0887236.1 unnamed protein product [Cyprideis torosa]
MPSPEGFSRLRAENEIKNLRAENEIKNLRAENEKSKICERKTKSKVEEEEDETLDKEDSPRRRVRIRQVTKNRLRNEAGLYSPRAAEASILRPRSQPAPAPLEDNSIDSQTKSDSETKTSARFTRRRLRTSHVDTSEKKDSIYTRRRNSKIRTTSKTSSTSPAKPKKPSHYKIVCYYTNWSQYRPKIGRYEPEDIDPELCTHIIFAFGWIKKGKLSSFETNDESVDGKIGLYEKITSLKDKNPDLKSMGRRARTGINVETDPLSFQGGWSFGTQKFKDMSKSRYTRQIFIFSAIPYLRERDFDGLDLDWEYPKGKTDKENYVLLLKELKEAFDAEGKEAKRPPLLLTAAVPVGPDNVNSGYDVPAVAGYLDFINLMAYDFHGKWERQTGHNAPLFAPSSDSEWRKQLSVSAAAEMWVRKGAPKDKLVIGMPTYGRSFTLANAASYHVNVPTTGGGEAGEYTREAGFLAYYEVCEKLLKGAKYVWDDEMKVPYMVEGSLWVGFDDERAIRNKMQWLKDEGYAGAMVWTLDMDDFRGDICGGGVKYPLIGAMREELRGVPRGGKDVDWASVSSKAEIARPTTLPPPEIISVEELLKSVNLRRKGAEEPKKQALDVPEYDASAPSVICYFTSWSPKRPGRGRFMPESIDPFLCTHLVYAFATLDDDHHLAPADEEADLGDGIRPGMYQRILELREKNPRLKILLAIGGWAFGSKPFKELTGNLYRMNSFVYEALEFLRSYKFDGLDVDWEYPRGQDDKARYVDLIRELRLAFNGEAETSGLPRLILSAAVPASFEAIAAGYDVPEISKYLDLINVMTYDFHGQWERQVGHNAPLFPLEVASSYQKKLTVDYSAREWIKQGAPAEKLMIGIPTYGRSFELVDPAKFDIGAPSSGGGEPGKYTGEAGFLSYYEVCDFLLRDNVTLVWDNEQQVPFAYVGNQWVGFDDERSIKTKMEWLREFKFGGVMVWSVDMDDFTGSCGMGKYPLLKAVHDGLSGYKVDREFTGPFDGPSAYNGKKKDPNEIVCEEQDGHITYHADKLDCTMYYMCEGDRKHHMPCPTKLVFNANENVCDWPERVEDCQHLGEPKESKKR